MNRALLALSVLSFSLVLAGTSRAASRVSASAAPEAAAVSGAQGTAISPDKAERLDPSVFHCGPISSKDPAIREQVTALYKEQWDLQQSTLARLREIGEAASGVTDSEARRALSKEGIELKKTLQLRNMELGLEIARLNEDVQRVADFEKALDQLQHPEKYMPVYTVDPELQARRLREQGITK
jgi:hypothetical protein